MKKASLFRSPKGHIIQSNQTNEHKLAIIITHSINFAKEKFMN